MLKSLKKVWWAMKGSNLRPLPCEGKYRSPEVIETIAFRNGGLAFPRILPEFLSSAVSPRLSVEVGP